MSLQTNEYSHELVYNQLWELSQRMESTEQAHEELLAGIHLNYRISAANLIHYLVLRSSEIRQAQEYLHKIGLSSLTSCESHTLVQINQVLKWLDPATVNRKESFCTFELANKLRASFTETLFGETSAAKGPNIMVTLSVKEANNRMQLEELLMAGMTVARINCAHDNQEVWKAILQSLKLAMARTGRPCKVYFDLAGPKCRVRSIWKKNEEVKDVKLEEGQLITLVGTAQAVSAKDSHQRIVVHIEPSSLLASIKVNDRIYFDDGKFEGLVVDAETSEAQLRITRISTKKPVLKVEKGINLPDSDLLLDALTEEDLENLPFVCEHADMVGYSFVSTPEDVATLRNHLRKHSGTNRPAIILKIERLQAVQNLPALLLSGMMDASFGVMIARGDLAVEIGFERLSEIQEEILWICEAAHVPVIWATQVLEALNKTGFATRSEITDAAMSVRAECVMLNKGNHLPKTIRTLDDILKRQMGHFDKKRYIMRPLGIAKHFFEKPKVTLKN
jgi:pyruvate kinase